MSLSDLTRAEFTHGMTRAGVDSVKSLKTKLRALRTDVEARDYKAFHKFAFEANAAGPPPVKTLEANSVVPFARTCLSRVRFPLLDELIAFLEASPKRAVTKDAWCQLLTFGETYKDDVKNYDTGAAWPVRLLEGEIFQMGG